jgi:quercetin dioxygenase-like cupin family protein
MKSQTSHDSFADIPLDEEVEASPGFFVERRSVLKALGGVAAGAVPLAETLGQESESIAAGMSLEQFLGKANPIATELVSDMSAAGQDHYLRTLAALAAGLHTVPMPERFNPTDQGLTPESYRIGFHPGGDAFRVLHWRLEPGAICRPHAHTYGNVVSLGLAGMVRVRNYEVVGAPDYGFGGTFQVTQTVDQLLTRGAINLVSLERNYIHGFVAGPEGARGLDITTPLKPRPEHSTPYLSIGDKPSDVFRQVFDASWEYG